MAKPTAFAEEGRGGDLCRARLAARMTGRQLAVLLGVSHATLCRIEMGTSKGNADIWAAARRLFPDLGCTATKPLAWGETLQAARVAAGLSRGQLRRLAGLSWATIRSIEEGAVFPTPATILELERVLGPLGYEGKEENQ